MLHSQSLQTICSINNVPLLNSQAHGDAFNALLADERINHSDAAARGDTKLTFHELKSLQRQQLQDLFVDQEHLQLHPLSVATTHECNLRQTC